MNEVLLIYFAFPIAVIIFSAILVSFINSPIKIALAVFSVFLVTTFAAYTSDFLVFTILYSFLSFLVAWITLRIIEQINSFNSIESIAKNNSQMLQDSIDISKSIYTVPQEEINENSNCAYNKNMRRYNRF